MREESQRCVHCGLDDCVDLFQRCLTLDYTSPDHLAVHHLVVPAYMLQHNAYNGDLVEPTARFILSHLDRGIGDSDLAKVRALRREVTRVVNPSPDPRRFDWARTVSDVVFEPAKAYQDSVKIWARSVAEKVLDPPL